MAAGCGGGTKGPAVIGSSGGGGAAWAPTLEVAPADVPGVIVYAAFAAPDDAGMMPAAPAGTAVWPIEGEAVDTLASPYHVLGGSGELVTAQAGAPTVIEHGCDGGNLNVLPLTPTGGATLPPGPAWAIRGDVPTGWDLAAAPIAAGTTSKTTRTWQAGPLTLTSATTTATAGALTITAGDQVIGSVPYERGTMDDDPSAVIDLTERWTPGIPTPVGVWLLAPTGPAVVALASNGFEGAGVSTYLVDDDSVELIEQLGTGIYYCAY